MFKLPQLPYSKNDLAPFINEEQFSFHYDKHHKAYIDNLNKFIETDTSLQNKSLEEIIKSSSAGIFNNSAQAYNHTFFWFNLAPQGKTGTMSDSLKQAIVKDFGSVETLREKFIDGGVKTFGSGWIWLCADKNNQLVLKSTSNAEVPFLNGDLRPLCVADVWEHAYYIDYRNARLKFLEAFWTQINWAFVSENFENKNLREFTKIMKA